MSECYFPGCKSHANTKEHIPPKSFFPDSKRINLMTVRSCKLHNNEKTKDDIYTLANICLNSIREDQSNAREIFEKNVKPQLMHNNEALLKKVLRNLSRRDKSTMNFEVDSSRLDSFFESLTHGVLYKKTRKKVDIENYAVRHIYMNLEETYDFGKISEHHILLKQFWKQNLLDNKKISEILEFKAENPSGYSTEIYSVRIMGVDFLKAFSSDCFNSSITVIHEFFSHFVVVSLLTRVNSFENTPVHGDFRKI